MLNRCQVVELQNPQVACDKATDMVWELAKVILKKIAY